MEMVFLEEESEISVVDENLHDASAKNAASKNRFVEDNDVPAAVPGLEEVGSSCCRDTAVFLLCFVSLTGLVLSVSSVNLFVYMSKTVTRSNSNSELKTVLLQTSYDELLKERNQLSTSYNNLLSERRQLENNLIKERDQLRTSSNKLIKERNQLRTRYDNLTKERDQLQTSNNDLIKERNQLSTSYNNLLSERRQLENNLTKERDQLRTSSNKLMKERNQLRTRYDNLTKETDQLQTSNNILSKDREQLQVKNEALTKDRNDLQRKLEGIEASCKNLTEETNKLKKNLDDFASEGWTYFGGSLYNISATEKTWEKSRQDCRHKGADLVIINSKEEQDFTIHFKENIWIGLTDSETEGTWHWVDGTPLTTSYWYNGEPNNSGDEDCVEIQHYDNEHSWNDRQCSQLRRWMCEKRVLP